MLENGYGDERVGLRLQTAGVRSVALVRVGFTIVTTAPIAWACA